MVVLRERIYIFSIGADNCVDKKKDSAERLLKVYNAASYNRCDNDVDDGGRNKSYPTRSYIGERGQIGKEHEWIIEPLILFGGLIYIREYNYRFKNSIAYYQLLTLDVPYTDYDHKDKKKEVVVDDESIELNKRSLEKARSKLK